MWAQYNHNRLSKRDTGGVRGREGNGMVEAEIKVIRSEGGSRKPRNTTTRS